MRLKPWLFLIIVALPVSGFIIWLFSASVFPKPEPEKVVSPDSIQKEAIEEPLISFVDPWKGSSTPRITIVEYGDYACPYCRQSAEEIDRILSERDDIKFVWKDLPSSLHPGADVAAEAGHCAKDQGKFWEFQKTLFSQSDYFNHTSLTLAANEEGLDLERFGNCLSGREKKYMIERSVNEAEALNIDGIPYFFINGERYSGKLNYEEFLEAIR